MFVIIQTKGHRLAQIREADKASTQAGVEEKYNIVRFPAHSPNRVETHRL